MEAAVSGNGPIATWIQRALLALGAVCLGYVAYASVEARHFQRERAAAFDEQLSNAPSISGGSSAPIAVEEGSTVAMLEIPRLRITTPVVHGDSDAILDVAAGHLPDTPLPWQPGNSAIAAHRDTLFRPLRNVRIGDEIHVRTPHGEFTYTVRDTRIVKPSDLSVLEPTGHPMLTLITCYPFDYIGAAPKRFIVHAARTATAAP